MQKTIHCDEYRALVSSLRRRREVLGLTQSDVARALGWKQQTYAAVEGGTRRLDILEFVAVGEQLSLTADELLSLVRDMLSALRGPSVS